MAIKAGNIVVVGHPELSYKADAPAPVQQTPVEETVNEVVEEEIIETTSPEEADPRIFNSTKKVSQYMEDVLNGGEFLLFDNFINKSNNS